MVVRVSVDSKSIEGISAGAGLTSSEGPAALASHFFFSARLNVESPLAQFQGSGENGIASTSQQPVPSSAIQNVMPHKEDGPSAVE
jgi:hypothetical protein